MSVYEALEDGQIGQMSWSRSCVQLTQQQSPVWISVESTSIAQTFAETSPDRGIIYVPNLPHAKRPVSVGWQFSTEMLLPTTRSSWGALLAHRRIQSNETAVEQVEQLLPELSAHTRLLADRWYVTDPFLQACQRLQMGALLGCKRNRKLYRPAPPKVPGKRGSQGKDGALFQDSKPESWGKPDEEWKGEDSEGKQLLVQAWHHLHFRQAREVEVSIYRVV